MTRNGEGTYAANNIVGDPLFEREYSNGSRENTVNQPELTTVIQAPPAFDEGGNFIRLNFGPLSLTCGEGTAANPYAPCSNYRLRIGSPALDAADTQWAGVLSSLLRFDFDGQRRPDDVASPTSSNRADIGADERKK